MNLFNVYPLYDLVPVKGRGSFIYDNKGNEYLDLYGGHAVISIGHSHPEYISKLKSQLEMLGFYSNSIINPLQHELAEKLGQLSDCEKYNLFLCNTGAEANENALKLASFSNGKRKVLAFNKAFHGRTSAAVSVTDNPNIIAEINKGLEVVFTPLNNVDAFKNNLKQHKKEIAAVIIEGIQGIGGIRVPEIDFLKTIYHQCKKNNIVLILDEIQSGFGRTGNFFAFQYADIEPDIITIAKGMGNGFPVGGVLIHNKFKAKHGLLGTTFGGNHLACAASIAVLDVINKEKLLNNANLIGNYLISELKEFSQIKEVRGKGLMIGLEFDYPIKELRKSLLFDYKVFTGISGDNIIRLLPPLNINKNEAELFISALKKAI